MEVSSLPIGLDVSQLVMHAHEPVFGFVAARARLVPGGVGADPRWELKSATLAYSTAFWLPHWEIRLPHGRCKMTCGENGGKKRNGEPSGTPNRRLEAEKRNKLKALTPFLSEYN